MHQASAPGPANKRRKVVANIQGPLKIRGSDVGSTSAKVKITCSFACFDKSSNMPEKRKGVSKPSGKFAPNGIPPNPTPPFKKASTKLEPFLISLPKDHVYITHIDSHSRDFKRQIFLVPLILNVSIIILLLWRAKSIAPFYTNLFLAGVGYKNDTTMTPADMSWEDIIREVARRSGSFLVDFVLYYFVVPWPQAFFIGSDFGTPVEWRWNTGFRSQEIVVRRSKRWDVDLGDVAADQTTPKSRLFASQVKVAASKVYMQDKTGYQMLSKDWELDFLAMEVATGFIDKKDSQIALEDFETQVLFYSTAYGWLVYETRDGVTTEEDAQRRKIISFKDELTAMGKENLFFKWIELIQFESSQAGESGPDRQAKTIEKAKAMFEAQDVDFDAFWKKIGGMDGMPGIEQFS